MKKHIGGSTHSTIHVAIHIKTGKKVAVKVIAKSSI